MYTFPQLLKELKARDIILDVLQGTTIKYYAKAGTIDDEILEGMKYYKNKLISHLSNPRSSNIMPIQINGTEPPFFLIHAQEANYFISEELGKNRPVYGFFHLGSDGHKVKQRTIEQFTSLYIEQIETIEPNGPYYLAGFSFGGILAFSIAVKLQQMGKEVKFLAVVDAVGDKYIPKRRFKKYPSLKSTIKQNFYYPVYKFISNNSRILISEILYAFKKPIPVVYRPFIIVSQYFRVYERSFTPEKFNGEIVLITTDSTEHFDKKFGWGEYADNVIVYDTVGAHSSIFRNRDIGVYIAKELTKIS